MAKLVLTVVGNDRPGLVTALSAAVVEAGGNWLESQLGRVAGTFAGVVLVEVPDAQVATLEQTANALAEGGVLEVTFTPADRAAPLAAGESLHVAVLGKDRPGIVREVSGALSSLGATIVSLTTQTRDAPMGDGVIFEADADVWLPLNVTAEAVQQAIEALSHDVVVDLTEVEEQ